MLRQIFTTIGLFASIIAFLIGAALAVAIIFMRPELGPGLKDVRITRTPEVPLFDAIGESEPLRRLLIARARKAELTERLRAQTQKARPSLAKAAVAWPQERASRNGLASLARERTQKRLAQLPERKFDLGLNQKHFRAVTEASMLTGLSPAAIAALIDAEASKTRSGAWDPRSSNPNSSARGLAQFLESTWLQEARNPNRYLHQVARRRGLIDAKGAPKRGAKRKKPAQAAARPSSTGNLAKTPAKQTTRQEGAQTIIAKAQAAQSAVKDGRDDKAQAPAKKPAVPAPAKKKHASPEELEARNLRKLLAMRLEPRIAIIAAAELAADNLVALGRSGYRPQDDEAAAKLAYLAHHEGLRGARGHLAGVVNRARASRRLKANITAERAEKLLHAHDGKPHRAYAAWLEDYIDARIQPGRFHAELK